VIRVALFLSLAMGSFSVYAAVKKMVPVVDAPVPIAIDLREILSMPAENRVSVAEARRDSVMKDLEVYAFEARHDFADRWKAVVLYAQLAGPEAKKFLNRSLKSSEWFMRNAGLVAYQAVLPKDAALAARNLLADKALVVRSAAISVLENHLDSEVREIFWGEIDQPRNFRMKQSLWTRPQMLQILAKEPKDREAPLFISYLREADPRMHQYAVLGLERLTRQTLGTPTSPLIEKRDLWLKWAKNTERAQRF
jgi:hypothetical protein